MFWLQIRQAARILRRPEMVALIFLSWQSHFNAQLFQHAPPSLLHLYKKHSPHFSAPPASSYIVQCSSSSRVNDWHHQSTHFQIIRAINELSFWKSSWLSCRCFGFNAVLVSNQKQVKKHSQATRILTRRTVTTDLIFLRVTLPFIYSFLNTLSLLHLEKKKNIPHISLHPKHHPTWPSASFPLEWMMANIIQPTSSLSQTSSKGCHILLYKAHSTLLQRTALTIGLST